MIGSGRKGEQQEGPLPRLGFRYGGYRPTKGLTMQEEYRLQSLGVYPTTPGRNYSFTVATPTPGRDSIRDFLVAPSPSGWPTPWASTR